MFHPVRGYIIPAILVIATLITGAFYVFTPNTIYGEEKPKEVVAQSEVRVEGKYVLANLEKMTVELHDGTTVIDSFPIVSKGKPGSYYETPGGNYANDYKEISHFSSIGHVFMPYSVHIFGNFFIHGIPYYPDGTKVASTYSGGCIRLADENAIKVFEFVKRGTPIIVTGNTAEDFISTDNSKVSTTSMEMTRLMVATISLEFLTQDNDINWNDSTSTRRTLLKDLLISNNDDVSLTFANYFGNDLFVQAMNDKAKSIGLANTNFTGAVKAADTTEADLNRFNQYIKDYKSYLLNLKN